MATRRWLVLAVVVGILTWLAAGSISASAIRSDAAQNTEMAFHLARDGVLALGTPTPQPTNYREPVPPAVHAVYLRLQPAFRDMDVADLLEPGAGARMAKGVNLWWALLVLSLTAAIGLRVLDSLWWTVVALCFVFGFFVAAPSYIDHVHTELPAAAWLLAVGWAAASAVWHQSWWRFALCGLPLGLLILTKAAFLYVGSVAVVGLVLLLKVQAGWTWRRAAVSGGLVVAVAAAIVLPWMARNHAHFGRFQLTQRGGVELLSRGFKTHMTDEEWRGSFYVYAERGLRGLIGPLLGYTERDYQSGGSLQRLRRQANDARDRRAVAEGRPDLAISYLRRAQAERRRLVSQLTREGHPHPATAADDVLGDKGIERILRSPWGHLRTTATFAWRGIWSFEPTRAPVVGELANLAAWLSLLGLSVLWIRRKAVTRTALVLAPLLMLLFHAVATHGLGRYSGPTIPFLIMAFCLVLQAGAGRLADVASRG